MRRCGASAWKLREAFSPPGCSISFGTPAFPMMAENCMEVVAPLTCFFQRREEVAFPQADPCDARRGEGHGDDLLVCPPCCLGWHDDEAGPVDVLPVEAENVTYAQACMRGDGDRSAPFVGGVLVIEHGADFLHGERVPAPCCPLGAGRAIAWPGCGLPAFVDGGLHDPPEARQRLVDGGSCRSPCLCPAGLLGLVDGGVDLVRR